MAGEISVRAINTGDVQWYWGAWYKLSGQSLPIFRCTNDASYPVQFNTFTFWAATAISGLNDGQGFGGNPITLTVSSTLHDNPTTVTISTKGYPYMQSAGGSWANPYDYNFTTDGVRDTSQGAQFIEAKFDSIATLNPNMSVDISFSYTVDYSKGIQWYPTDIGMNLIIDHIVWSYHSDGSGWVRDKDIYIYNGHDWVKQTEFHKYSGGSWS